MKCAAIIAEYNPLHNGHLFQLNKTRENGATHVISVMSGDFVQRSEPALLSKFTRARLAVQNGVDLVIELPTQYAVGSSERFAFGAVSLLDSLGCVDELSFGAETENVAILKNVANAVENKKTVRRTKELCETGISYPAARRTVVMELYGEQTAAVIDTPNNLLAVDYIKALDRRNSKIAPNAIKRIGASHDSDCAYGEFASASFLRANIDNDAVMQFMPKNTYDEIQNAKHNGTLRNGLRALSPIILYQLRLMTREQLCALPDCATGIGNRLYNALSNIQNVEQLMDEVKTKRYTMSRVRRAVCCAFLGIDENYYFNAPYARILAIGAKGEELLKKIKPIAEIPVSHSLKTLMEMNENARKTALVELRATDSAAFAQRKLSQRGLDFTTKLFKL